MGYREKMAETIFCCDTDFMSPMEITDLLVAALQQAGYCIVPLEPTREMIEAANPNLNLELPDLTTRTAFKAMLATRPKE
jgi:hypothetical protein